MSSIPRWSMTWCWACVDPVGEAGADIARLAALVAGYRRQRRRRADQPLLRLRPRCRQFRRGADHGRTARTRDRRRRRINEPRRHRVSRRRLVGRPVDRGCALFRAAGNFGRSDRDQIRIFARRCRRLRGRKPEARRGGVDRGPLFSFGDGGEGRERPDHSRQGRAHAAGHDHAVAGRVAAVVRPDGRAGRLRCRGHSGASRRRIHQSRPPRRQFVGHRRWRRRGAGRQRGCRQAGRA